MPSVLPNGPPLPKLTGLVVSAGLMHKTVKVRVVQQIYDKHLRKNYASPRHILTHDPNSSLREGDVVEIQPGWRASSKVHHVVTRLVAPFGSRVEERPPVPSRQEREDEWRRKLEEKRVRKGKVVFKKEFETLGGGTRVKETVVRVGVLKAVKDWEERNGRTFEGSLPADFRRDKVENA